MTCRLVLGVSRGRHRYAPPNGSNSFVVTYKIFETRSQPCWDLQNGKSYPSLTHQAMCIDSHKPIEMVSY